MTIFIIPSWYPNEKEKLSGIFIKEQHLEIAKNSKNNNFIIAKWDIGYNRLSLKKPHNSIINIMKFFKSKIEDKKIYDNFYEFYTPNLYWSQKLPFGGYKRILSSIEKSLKRAQNVFGKIDLIHAHVSYPAGYIAYLLSKKYNIPYILTEHMGPFPFKVYIKNGKIIEEILYAFNNSQKNIAVSSFLCNSIKNWNLRCDCVISNFIDENKFMYSNNKFEKFTFFTLCEITYEKGIDLLLLAIKNLKEEVKNNIQFIIGGGGKNLKKFIKFAEQLELKNIIWTGRLDRNEVPKYYQKSHAFIMLSRLETFGVVYIEAIASGIPVIASDCGGPKDIINYINGILVKNEDYLEASKAIEYLYYNYDKYNPIDIRSDFMNRFSKKKISEKYINLYKEVIDVWNSRNNI